MAEGFMHLGTTETDNYNGLKMRQLHGRTPTHTYDNQIPALAYRIFHLLREEAIGTSISFCDSSNSQNKRSIVDDDVFVGISSSSLTALDDKGPTRLYGPVVVVGIRDSISGVHKRRSFARCCNNIVESL